MNPAPEPKTARVTGFRTRLLLAMMLVVFTITALAVYFAERKLVANVELELQRTFQAEVAAWHSVQDIRNAALVERSRALARKSRIRAALEDNAPDLLYPSAENELSDVIAPVAAGPSVLHARFYRFLDQRGTVILPASSGAVGALTAEQNAQLALPHLPASPQTGYLVHDGDGGLAEIIATPIMSSESGEVIAAIVLGFKPIELLATQPDSNLRRGLWFNQQLHFFVSAEPVPAGLAGEVIRALAIPGSGGRGQRIELKGTPHLLLHKQLNQGSLYPPAHEVFLYSLAGLQARQRQLRWQVLGLGGLLLLGGLGASHVLARRLSQPVEKLAVDSAENLAQRERAEAALETTSVELERSVRFSADASHQLKTPLTVLRAGLEELLTQGNLNAGQREEVAALIHQTYRLSSVIKDLLLLSRMDAGRLQIEFSTVNLSQLIEAAVDDLSAVPDAADLRVETDFPPALLVAGEKRYLALILQNLLDNARKYNRPGGRIRIVARTAEGGVILVVGNTWQPIPPEVRAHIFERFHRGGVGENVPGYGLGLNIARQLARLHEGELRLARSDEEWTEFEARFRAAGAAPCT